MSSAPASSSKRKLSHVSKACSGCRRRRSKCDGGTPCQPCALTEEECTYTDLLDGRKAASKTYVDALHRRIQVLEKQLKDAGITQGTDEPPSKGKELAGDDPATDSDSATAAIEMLKIEDGDLRLYGNHSIFSHLPGPGADESPEPMSSTSFNGGPNFFAASSPSASGEQSLSADWARNLPRNLIDEQLHTHLLDLFDNYVNDWCGWTAAGNSGSSGLSLFRREMLRCCSIGGETRPPERTPYYSPMLHNAVLALATVFSSDLRFADGSISTEFANAAKSRIDVEVERPMLSTLQGLMILGSVHSGLGRHGAGYYYAGGGLRLSISLGLGLDTSPYLARGLVSQETKDERERGFYLTFIQDKLWSSYVGRPPTITSAHTNLRTLPAISKTKDDQLWHSRILTEQLGPNEIRISIPSYASTTFHWTAKLFVLAEKIAEAVYALKADLRASATKALASDLHLQLSTYYDQLPPAIQVSPHSNKPHPCHVLNLHLAFWFEMLLLHRPFVPRKRGEPPTTTTELAVKSCEKAVAKIMQLLQAYRRCPGLRYASISLTQISFLSGRYFLYIALQSSDRGSKKATAAVSSASTCVEMLDEMPWGCSKSTARALEQLIGQWNPAEVIPAAPQSQELSVPLNAQALDPHSELAKQLRALGWTPPVAVASVRPGPQTSLPPDSFDVSTSPFYAPLPLPSPLQQQHAAPSDLSAFHHIPSSWGPVNYGTIPSSFSVAQKQSPPLPTSGAVTDPFASASLPDSFAADASILALFESQAAFGMPVGGGWAPAGYGGLDLGPQPPNQWEGFVGWDHQTDGSIGNQMSN